MRCTSTMKSIHDNIEIIDWSQKFAQQANALLFKHEETSLFLLANLKTYGPKLTAEDTYSGDFKLLLKNGKVVAVFALAKIGNLIVQTDRADDYSKIIVDGKINKHMDKVLLFTGENNSAAIKLYTGLGFKQIGYFGLV